MVSKERIAKAQRKANKEAKEASKTTEEILTENEANRVYLQRYKDKLSIKEKEGLKEINTKTNMAHNSS